MCCARLAGNAGPQKNRHIGTIAQLCRAISSQLRHVSTTGKILLNSIISPTCPHNMVNVGPLAAEIVSLFWGTPANFNAVLGSVTARYSSSGRQPYFAALNIGRHLYLAGRPSRWALTHILVTVILCNRADHYIFALLFLSSIFFYSSPSLSGRRLDVYHTLTHGVALVRI